MPTQPTYENIPYGPHPAQTLDFFRAVTDGAAPLFVFIHGGGFRGGDKAALPEILREKLLAAGVSVAAVNYRLSDVAPFPAAMEDGSRAVQFLRYKADEWGLDKSRVAAGGGSAGAGTSLWIGFRPDQADAGHADPVRRESTRLSCIACWQAQCSYDAHFIGHEVLGLGVPSTHSALDTFFRVTPEQYNLPEVRAAFRASSAINYLTAQAPPVFVWYKTLNEPVTTDTGENVRIHHPRFGLLLKRRMNALGIECVVRLREEIGGADITVAETETHFLTEMSDFVIRRLSSFLPSRDRARVGNHV
jgi:acetyl esterase